MIAHLVDRTALHQRINEGQRSDWLVVQMDFVAMLKKTTSWMVTGRFNPHIYYLFANTVFVVFVHYDSRASQWVGALTTMLAVMMPCRKLKLKSFSKTVVVIIKNVDLYLICFFFYVQLFPVLFWRFSSRRSCLALHFLSCLFSFSPAFHPLVSRFACFLVLLPCISPNWNSLLPAFRLLDSGSVTNAFVFQPASSFGSSSLWLFWQTLTDEAPSFLYVEATSW